MKAERLFPPVPASVPTARRFVLGELRGLEPGVRDIAALLVSELVTNSVLYAGSEVRVRVKCSRRELRVEVEDTSDAAPELRSSGELEVHGRGLRIVQELSRSWGVVQSRGRPGKTVWFALDCQPGASSLAPTGLPRA
ncbi:MAG: sensor protein [Acidimicrobiaceae bacterium]|nr:sensor protein [Acidimicrobiaceae bacterium]